MKDKDRVILQKILAHVIADTIYRKYFRGIISYEGITRVIERGGAESSG